MKTKKENEAFSAGVNVCMNVLATFGHETAAQEIAGLVGGVDDFVAVAKKHGNDC